MPTSGIALNVASAREVAYRLLWLAQLVENGKPEPKAISACAPGHASRPGATIHFTLCFLGYGHFFFGTSPVQEGGKNTPREGRISMPTTLTAVSFSVSGRFAPRL